LLVHSAVLKPFPLEYSIKFRYFLEMSGKKYKLIALDLDGTLLDNEHRVTDENAKYLRDLQKRGVIVSIATGRSFYAVIDAIKALALRDDIPVVCANGACGVRAVVKNDTVVIQEQIFHQPVSKAVTQIALQVAKSLGHVVQYYLNDDIYANASEPFHYEITKRYAGLTGVQHIYCQEDALQNTDAIGLPSKILIMCGEQELQKTLASLGQAFEDTNETAYMTQNASGWFVEVLSTNKGLGLQRMCDALNIPIQGAVAFGDGHNDLEFVQCAGLGVAMKNAVDVIAEAADVQCEWSNVEGGVWRHLKQMEGSGLLDATTL